MGSTILVPLDGSRAAETAAWHAAALAGAVGEGIELLQVLEAPPRQSDVAPHDLDWRLQRAEAAAYLSSVADRLAERGVDATTALETGGAAERIVHRARCEDVALVVMAAHGRGEAAAFAFGGTTHKVLSRAPTSVMVVRRGGDAGTASPVTGYRSVLVPLDGSAASEWALALATKVARHHQADLLLIHLLLEPAPPWERLPSSAEELELRRRLDELQAARADRYLGDMVERLAHTDLRVRSARGRAADVAEGIRALAEAQGVDLIALAAHGARGAPRPFGTVAQRLLATSALPIIVFQDAPEAAEPALGRPAAPPSGGREPPPDAADLR